MAEYITLLGAEDVQNAANTMRRAADSMAMSLSNFSEQADMRLRRVEDLVCRIESVVERLELIKP